MSLVCPPWAKGAHPTLRGWVRNGELLKSQQISQADIDQWYGVEVAPASEVVHEIVEVVEHPVETSEVEDLESLTKIELEELGREHGVELDRRLKKQTLVEQVRSLFSR